MGQQCSCDDTKEPGEFVSSMSESDNYPKRTEAQKVPKMNQSSPKVERNLMKYGQCSDVSDPKTRDHPYIGPFKYHNGSTYAGQYFKGLRSGMGEEIDMRGNYYSGNFKNDLKHGQGIEYFVNGDVYIGLYERGLCHGKGTFIENNEATIYDGELKNGRKDGLGEYLVDN